MKKMHVFCRVVTGFLALALICASALPLLRSNAWWIRVLDFPRIQIAILIVLTLAVYGLLYLWRRLRVWDHVLAAGLGLALVWQLISIAPYTTLYPKEMMDASGDNPANRLSLLVYNVLAENREVDALLELIGDTDPDLVLLSEPNQWWFEQLDSLEERYRYTLHQPQDNKYGMMLFSRLELVDPEIRFLIEPSVPSIRTQVRLRSGALVTLYGVHPRPPGVKPPEGEEEYGEVVVESGDTDREDSDMRDAELMVVAQEVKALGAGPVIVAGDFNDVAWSHTTHLFQRIGGLLDPRVGRGLFNTFDTKSRLMRYPLDHSFATRHFLLAEMRRLPDSGSDHFPLLVVLDYAPDASGGNDVPQQNAGDEKESDEAIEEGQSID